MSKQGEQAFVPDGARRAFTLLDLIILVAGLAIGFAWLRALFEFVRELEWSLNGCW